MNIETNTAGADICQVFCFDIHQIKYAEGPWPSIFVLNEKLDGSATEL
jgi:hypothetical protein